MPLWSVRRQVYGTTFPVSRYDYIPTGGESTKDCRRRMTWNKTNRVPFEKRSLLLRVVRPMSPGSSVVTTLRLAVR
jgi:hypothetical protein